MVLPHDLVDEPADEKEASSRKKEGVQNVRKNKNGAAELATDRASSFARRHSSPYMVRGGEEEVDVPLLDGA